MREPTRRIAVLGGSFDPVHNGHLALIEEARRELEAVEGWLLPAGLPSLRGAPAAPARDRRDLLTAAVADRPGLRVSELELERPGRSYTIDTLEQLAVTHPGSEFWWLLGADAARRVGQWHRSADVLAVASLAVVQRRGRPAIDLDELVALGFSLARTRLLATKPPALSATQVRERVAAELSLEGLVPPGVAALIRDRGLYSAREAAHNARG